jgi:hypothetical protein
VEEDDEDDDDDGIDPAPITQTVQLLYGARGFRAAASLIEATQANVQATARILPLVASQEMFAVTQQIAASQNVFAAALGQAVEAFRDTANILSIGVEEKVEEEEDDNN